MSIKIGRSCSDLLEANYAYHYRDTLGLPDWSHRVQKRMAMGEAEANVARIVQLLGSLQGIVIVDVGCGWGDVVTKLNEMTKARCIVGIDPDSNRVKLASKRRQDGPQIISGVGESLPLADNSVDVVCSYQVLEHVQDKQLVVDEILRVLKPGGYLHVKLPNHAAFFEAHYKIRWLPFFHDL